MIEFVLGLYRARTGKYKSSKSQLPQKILVFLDKMFADGYLTELLLEKHGFGAWFKQEFAYNRTPGRTPPNWAALVGREQVLRLLSAGTKVEPNGILEYSKSSI